MNNNDKITLVTVCDNNFPMLLGTLLRSIQKNHVSSEPIDFYIVSDKISIENRSKLTECAAGGNIKIKWFDIEDIIPENTNIPVDTTTYPLNIYARLFIPFFMPQHLRKAIYLDVDMILLKDISELWNINIGNKIIGAVQEPNGRIGENVKNWQQLGLSYNAPYINSGMLVINMTEWRNKNITDAVLKCIRDNKIYTFYPDQYGINVVLADSIFLINEKWNTFSNLAHPDPSLIHFIGYKPIYKDYIGEKTYLELFRYYFSLTPWKSFTPKSKYIRYFMKLNRKVKKVLMNRFKVNYHYL